MKTILTTALVALACTACGGDDNETHTHMSGDQNAQMSGDNNTNMGDIAGDGTASTDEVMNDDSAGTPSDMNGGSMDMTDDDGPMDERPINGDDGSPDGMETDPEDGMGGAMPMEDTPNDEPIDQMGEGIGLDNLVNQIAVSACETLTRCCDDSEVSTFWSAISTNPRFEDVRHTLPPQVPHDPDTCVETLTRAYNVAPFGHWVGAASAGLVNYNAEAAAGCFDALENAECGRGVLETLYDGECFGFQPPLGADRVAFPRSGAVGEPCMAIADGASGGFFGTCNPNVGWCATETDNGAYRITPAGAMGTCVATTPNGEGCGLFPSAAVCARGSNCSIDSMCEAEPDVDAVEAGAPCWDSVTYTTLATCVDSFCDVTGTGLCTEYKDTDGQCTAGFECLSNNCLDGLCADRTYCGGL